MSRMQLALNVDDLDEAVTFYSKLFGAKPAKLKEGYANFALTEPALKLVLLENPGRGGTINHFGVEVESSDKVHAEIARLTGEGLFTDEEIGTTCCFATQDKVWVTGPAGEKWEVYTVLADSDTFGNSPQHLEAGTAEGGVCCGGTAGDAEEATAVRPAAEGRRRDRRGCCAGVGLCHRLDICQYRRMSKSRLQLIDASGCAIAPLAREPLSIEAAAELAAKLKALSDPVRLRLLSVVASHAGGEACVCDLSVGIELTQPTISHHLKVLRTAGLLDSERRGSWVYYQVVADALQQLSLLLDTESPAAIRT